MERILVTLFNFLSLDTLVALSSCCVCPLALLGIIFIVVLFIINRSAKKRVLKTLFFITLIILPIYTIPYSVFFTYKYLRYYNFSDKSYSIENLDQVEKDFLGLGYDTELSVTKVDEYGKFTFYSSSERGFNENEIIVLKDILSKMPQKFIDSMPKRVNIISVGHDIDGIGYAMDNYVYLTNDIFTDSYNYLDLTYVLAHELVHVVQTYSIEEDVIKTRLKNSQNIDYNKDCAIVQSYISTSGWKLSDDGKDYIIDKALEAHKTSDYGKESGPSEDMADAIAYYFTGNKILLSENRIKWIESFLEDSNVKTYVPGVVTGFIEEISFIPDSDPTSITETEDIDNTYLTNLEKDKNIESGEYNIKQTIINQHKGSDGDSFDDYINIWKSEQAQYGWEFAQETAVEKTNNIQAKKLIFNSERGVMVIILEDRRTYSNKKEQDEMNKNIVSNNNSRYYSSSLDSYYKNQLQMLIDYENSTKEQGLYAKITFGILLNQ